MILKVLVSLLFLLLALFTNLEKHFSLPMLSSHHALMWVPLLNLLVWLSWMTQTSLFLHWKAKTVLPSASYYQTECVLQSFRFQLKMPVAKEPKVCEMGLGKCWCSNRMMLRSYHVKGKQCVQTFSWTVADQQWNSTLSSWSPKNGHLLWLSIREQ